MEGIINVITRVLAVAEGAGNKTLGRPATTIVIEPLSREYGQLGSSAIEGKDFREVQAEGIVVGKLVTPDETFLMLRVSPEIHHKLPKWESDVLLLKQEKVTIDRSGRRRLRPVVDYLAHGGRSHPGL